MKVFIILSLMILSLSASIDDFIFSNNFKDSHLPDKICSDLFSRMFLKSDKDGDLKKMNHIQIQPLIETIDRNIGKISKQYQKGNRAVSISTETIIYSSGFFLCNSTEEEYKRLFAITFYRDSKTSNKRTNLENAIRSKFSIEEVLYIYVLNSLSDYESTKEFSEISKSITTGDRESFYKTINSRRVEKIMEEIENL